MKLKTVFFLKRLTVTFIKLKWTVAWRPGLRPVTEWLFSCFVPFLSYHDENFSVIYHVRYTDQWLIDFFCPVFIIPWWKIFSDISRALQFWICTVVMSPMSVVPVLALFKQKSYQALVFSLLTTCRLIYILMPMF